MTWTILATVAVCTGETCSLVVPRSASNAYHCCLPKPTAGLEEIFQNDGIGHKKQKKQSLREKLGPARPETSISPSFWLQIDGIGQKKQKTKKTKVYGRNWGRCLSQVWLAPVSIINFGFFVCFFLYHHFGRFLQVQL